MKEADVRHAGRNDVHEKRNVVENTELLLKFKDLKERNEEDSMYYKPCCLNTEYFFWSPPPTPICLKYKVYGFFLTRQSFSFLV